MINKDLIIVVGDITLGLNE